MTKPYQRTLKKKIRKSSSKKTRIFVREKPSKKRCPVTGEALKGVPHARKCKANKQSKTEKRPSVPFGGVLSSKAREQVFIETGKIVAGVKKIDDVNNKYRKYVKQALEGFE
ncbi:MAG: 50S ribosomal protein L34e [archaeon]|jgi:ribosomal protein L34E